MTLYRIVFRDEDDQPFAESSVKLPDVDAAIEHSRRHHHPHEVEVWQGERLVARRPALAARRG
jgi:hypothetical protein